MTRLEKTGLILAFMLCIAGVAQAQTCPQVATNKAHICVVGPTQFTDNTAIPAGTSITYKYFQQSGTTWNQIGTNATTTGTSEFTTGVLAPGTYTFRVTATVNAVESDPSNTANKTATNPQPNPPTIVIAELQITIPLDSKDGFKRTLAMSITASGPGVPVGFVKVSTPVVGEPVFTWRNQRWCRFLPAHPRTGASNIAWIKGVSTSTDAAAPCA